MAIDTSLPKDIRILQAAEEVFSQHGYEKATLDEIIALADVGKGTVYKYFGNDEYNILSQLIEQAMHDNLLKHDTVPEITTKFVFFGVAMSIFNQSDDIAADMTDEEAARIITDHFLRGNAR